MFNLVRYFSTLSLVLIGIVATLLTFYYRNITHEQLLQHEQNRAEDVARIFENSLWPLFRPVIDAANTGVVSAKPESASNTAFRTAIANLMQGTDVIKVKIYSLDGITAFSTDPKQIGENKARNPGFLAALKGKPITELTRPNQINSFEGTLEDRDVFTTYVPIHANPQKQGRIEGVFEVYFDVSEFVQSANAKLKWVSLMVLAVLGSLYLAQLMVVRRAQSLLRIQATALENSNHELDQRVSERTSELQNEVNERRQVEQRLDYLAHHDPLTDLPNRHSIKEKLSHSLTHAAQTQTQLAVLFIGLDQFKEVNETLGHAVGDDLLIVVTRRLQASLRPGDTLARLGGDEFICVLEAIQEPSEVAQEAKKLLTLFQQPFAVGNNLLYLSASIGTTQAPKDGEDVPTLVRNANAALYQAKAHGRNRSHAYTPEMTVISQERHHLAGHLRQSIADGELFVHYQPKINALSGEFCGAEALLRWTSAAAGPISPARFIPLAEEIGFIIELGTWVLRETCRQMVAWDEAGFSVPRVSVNLSVKQLERENFSQLLRSILDETGLDPSRLELEITESVIMEVDNAFDILADLRQLGVHISIDDFGTGYSSLAYLKKLPVQTLKIDRAFVMGIGHSRSDETIIQAILKISNSLGLSTVAEGVETAQQMAFLRHLNCTQIQGYFYGAPVNHSDFFNRWVPQAEAA